MNYIFHIKCVIIHKIKYNYTQNVTLFTQINYETVTNI